MDTGTLIELVAIINNNLKVKEELLQEQVKLEMPATVIALTAGEMLGLIRFRDYLQEGIEVNISAMESAQGM